MKLYSHNLFARTYLHSLRDSFTVLSYNCYTWFVFTCDSLPDWLISICDSLHTVWFIFTCRSLYTINLFWSDENRTRFILNEKFTHNASHNASILTFDSLHMIRLFSLAISFFFTWDLKFFIFFLHVINLFSKCDSLQMIHLLSRDSLHMIRCYLHDNFTRFIYSQMRFVTHDSFTFIFDSFLWFCSHVIYIHVFK